MRCKSKRGAKVWDKCFERRTFLFPLQREEKHRGGD
jgi:hypothetical protein